MAHGLTEVATATWSLAMDSPAGSVPYSFCYLFLDMDGGVHVLDPGADTPGNRTRLGFAIRTLDRNARTLPASMTITHGHHDQSVSPAGFRRKGRLSSPITRSRRRVVRSLSAPAR